MPTLITIQMPISWSEFGFPPHLQTGATCLIEGAEPAWAWEGEAPDLGIASCQTAVGVPVAAWGTDHIVILTASVDEAAGRLGAVGLNPRLRMTVQGRPTAFFRVGPVLEVVQSPVRAPAIFGIALVTDESLESVALRWRSLGHEVTDPRPAIQPGRRILTVKGLQAGLAVMSPDRSPPRHRDHAATSS
jgi:hypothetical protein